jgi:hypothetical protein
VVGGAGGGRGSGRRAGRRRADWWRNAEDGIWHNLGAIGEVVNLVHTEKTKTSVSLGVKCIPGSLASCWVREDCEAAGGLVVLGESIIGWQSEDTSWLCA